MTKQSVKVYYRELKKKKTAERGGAEKKKKIIHVKIKGQPSVLPAVRGVQDDISQKGH